MAVALLSPVRRLSVDVLLQNQTPSKEANQLQNLLESNVRIADSANGESVCNERDIVMVKMKDGSTLKLCEFCSRSSSVQKNSAKPKKPGKTVANNKKDPQQPKPNPRKATNKNSSANPSASAKPKEKVAKTTKTNKAKPSTSEKEPLVEKKANKKPQDTKKTQKVVKPTKRTATKPQEAKNTTKSQVENKANNRNVPKATREAVSNARSLRKKQDPNNNHEADHDDVADKSVKKPTQRQKKNDKNIDKNKSHSNSDPEKRSKITDKNSKSSNNNDDDHNKAADKLIKKPPGQQRKNVRLNIPEDKTTEMNHTVPSVSSSKHYNLRVQKKPVAAAHKNNDKNVSLPINLKKPSRYSLTVKKPQTKEKYKKKSSKNKEQPVASTPKKSQGPNEADNSSEQEKKKTSKNNKKQNSETDVKIAKIKEKLSKYRADGQEQEAIEDDLSATELESKSSDSSWTLASDTESEKTDSEMFSCLL